MLLEEKPNDASRRFHNLESMQPSVRAVDQGGTVASQLEHATVEVAIKVSSNRHDEMAGQRPTLGKNPRELGNDVLEQKKVRAPNPLGDNGVLLVDV